jgi:hypothetical protein
VVPVELINDIVAAPFQDVILLVSLNLMVPTIPGEASNAKLPVICTVSVPAIEAEPITTVSVMVAGLITVPKRFQPDIAETF